MLTARLYIAVFLLTAIGTGQQPAAPPAPSAGSTQSGAAAEEQPVPIGGPVKPPQILHSVQPDTTDAARKAHFCGNVEVSLWVDKEGNPTHVVVTRGVGMGLDIKALEAVRQYKFKPAMKNGQPVIVALRLDINFDILPCG